MPSVYSSACRSPYALRVEELAEILAFQFDETAPLSFNEDLWPLIRDKWCCPRVPVSSPSW